MQKIKHMQLSFILMAITSFSAMGQLSENEEVLKPKGQTFSFKENLSPFAWDTQEKLAFGDKGETNALLIIKDDSIVYERYKNGFNKEKPHRLWSITKSLSSLILGIRLSELNLNPSAKLTKFIPDLKSAFSEQLTLRHLLHMSSGFKWNEFYESNPFESDVVAMLYYKPFMGTFVATKPSHHPPGSHFSYSSGDTNLLMRWFKNSFKKTKEGEETHKNYPWSKLFDPLGIENATWEQDNEGVFVGSSYGYMTARDLAKIGRLILANGVWKENGEPNNDKVIISKAFLKESLLNSPSVCKTPIPKFMKSASYGFHWWLNRPCPGRDPYIDHADNDIVMALGHHGQTLVAFPKHNAIAVRFGSDKKSKFPRKQWIEAVNKTLREL